MNNEYLPGIIAPNPAQISDGEKERKKKKENEKESRLEPTPVLALKNNESSLSINYAK